MGLNLGNWMFRPLGHFVLGMFCPLGRFVRGTFCPWDVLSWDVLYVHHNSNIHKNKIIIPRGSSLAGPPSSCPLVPPPRPPGPRPAGQAAVPGQRTGPPGPAGESPGPGAEVAGPGPEGAGVRSGPVPPVAGVGAVGHQAGSQQDTEHHLV